MARKNKSDGISNVMTGLGDFSFDKRLYSEFELDRLTTQQLTTIYRSNALAARVVDLPVEDMFREGWDIKVDGDEELPKLLQAQADDLGLKDAFKEAKRLERLFGGALILINAKDSAMGTKGLSEPLDVNNLQAVESLAVFDATEVNIAEWEANPLSKNYGKPVRFNIVPATLGASASAILSNVHYSRCIWFGGLRATKDMLRQTPSNSTPGWGDSVLTRLHGILRDYGATWESVAGLLQDFSVAVLHLSGLNAALLADKDSAVIRRLQTTQLMRSMFRGYLLDKEESFERKSTPLTGLPEIMDRLSETLAAAAGMPVTVLFGQAPAGLNATGDADVRMWYDRVAAMQRNELKPSLERVYKLMLLAKQGPARGREPESWNVCFNPLWQISENEKATIRYNMAQADIAYINAGVLDPHEVAEARFGGDAYSLDTSVMRDEDESGEELEASPVVASSQKVVELAKAATKGELPADVGLLVSLGMPEDVAKQLVAAIEVGEDEAEEVANGQSNLQGADAPENGGTEAPPQAPQGSDD